MEYTVNMRNDMTKLFYERGNRGSLSSWRRERHRMKGDVEYSPPQGMRKVHLSHHRGNEQKLNLNPLYRFLLSQVGKNWDEVYSDLRNNLKGNPSYYVLDWIPYLVERNVQIIDGIMFESNGRFEIKSYSWSNRKSLYVCPTTNKLLIAPDYKKSNKENHNDIDSYQRKSGNLIEKMIDSSDNNTKYCRLNGVWYEVKFDGINYFNGEIYNTKKTKKCELDEWTRNYAATKDGEFMYRYQFDILSKDTIELKTFFSRYGVLGKPLTKHQLNKKEIKNIILKS